MVNRSLGKVIVLTIVTLSIYSLVWFVKTKGEMNARGSKIPTAWLIIIPIANIYWFWKYFEAAEQVTNGQSSAVLYFLLGILVSPIIPMLLLQSEFNKTAPVNPAVAGGTPPVAPEAPAPAKPEPVVPPKDTNPPQPPVVQ